jgi:hypothetical protein
MHGRRVVVGLAALLAAGAGCGGASDPPDVSAHALAVDGDADGILDFESTSGWSWRGGSLSTTTTRTHGAGALQFDKSARDAHLTSAKIASTATALRGLDDAGSAFALDVTPPSGGNVADIGITLSCPSRNLNNVDLGRQQLRNPRPGVYQTLRWAIPARVRTALAGQSYSDLTFDLRVNHESSQTGTYRFDHLRVHSPSADPGLGAGQSAELIAIRNYRPSYSMPGQADFPISVAQVPQSFHVKLGRSGTGTATFELGFGGTAAITCTYNGGDKGASFILSSCTNGVQAGDLVSADYARLIINEGDRTAGPTKVRAQIALNPVGEITGSGVIPPMPTFWGETGAQASQIVTDYFNAVNANQATEERWIKAPAPSFAQRNGDGSPNDNLVGVPPPPNDPPFDQEGHMNRGSDWDAYWRLNGNLTTNAINNHATTHLEANLGAHAVVWGYDKEVVRVSTTINTDQGEVQQDGFRSPTASGSLDMYLWGSNHVFHRDADPKTGFAFDFDHTENFDLPPIGIWIFSIQLGVNTTVGIHTQGALSFAGMAVNVTPSASVGAHIWGGVNIGIASGGVDAVVDLLRVSTPLNASATWRITTAPGPDACGGFIDLDLNAQLKLSALGGHVDLVAKFGVCPFCYHDSWNIFAWKPIDLGTKDLFKFTQSGKVFSLPDSLCRTTLQPHITAPTSDVNIIAGLGVQLSGYADRPSTNGASGYRLPCESLVWTDPYLSGDTPIAYGCTPVATFAASGWHLLTLTANDPFGETGSTAQWILVNDPPVALTAHISTPTEGSAYYYGPPASGLVIQGGAAGGTGTYAFYWVATSASGKQVYLGEGPSVTWYPPAPDVGNWTITQIVYDSAGAYATADVHILFYVIN